MKRIIVYVKESIKELGKVSWPSREATIRLTLSVIIFSVCMALFIGLVDYGLVALVEKVIIKG